MKRNHLLEDDENIKNSAKKSKLKKNTEDKKEDEDNNNSSDETKEETSNVEKSTTTLLQGSVRKMFLGDSSQKLILQLGEVNFIEEKKTVHCCMSDGEEYSQFVYFGPGLTNRARKLD